MDLQIGSTVGDYQVIGILGAGGMGKVYKVRNVISDRVEAMKVLLPDLAHAPDLADRFLREIKVQGSLEHPNIASLHTALRVDNQLLMLMECVEGVTLEQKLKAEGPIAVGEAVDYIRQVLAALDYAHTQGVVHRDIKPANMMLTAAGMVKLMDFGIARAPADQKLTMTGTTLGSLYYMSPEQIQGAVTVDSRSDLYSVGVSLYELVTGKRPFDGDSQFAIMAAHLQQTPVPPITLDPRLPQALNDAILMSVSKNPNDRFQTAGAFRNALGNVVPAAQPAAPAFTPAPAAAPSPVAAATAALPTAPMVNNYPAAPPPVQPAAQPSHRAAWMVLGAVVMAAAAIAAIEFGPWKGTKAAVPQQPQVQQQANAGQTPASTLATPQTPPPSEPQGSPVVAVVKPEVSQPSQAAATPSRPSQAGNRKPAHEANAGQASAPPAYTPPTAQPEPVRPPQAQPEAPPPRPTAPAVDLAELQEARETFAQMTARAAGVHSSLQTMRNSLASQGLNLRGDMQTAASMLDTYMRSANSALHAGDLAQGKVFLDKAEQQLGVLEKFLNR